MDDMFRRVHELLHQLTPARPVVMQAMEAHAREQRFPIVGPLVGRLLYQLARMIDARKIFELGSGFGYSAYWFSLAVQEKGRITLTDGDENNLNAARSYLSEAGLKSEFSFLAGDAVTQLGRQGGIYDIIYNDIDKQGYPETIEAAAQHLRPGGLFITDNIIWSGRVCNENPDKTTAAIIDFTSRLYRDERFFTSVVPLRDGVSIAIKI
ncbi:MAG: O-methyltransferase [bacterium]